MKDTVTGRQVPRISAAVEALRQCLGIDAKRIIDLLTKAQDDQTDILTELRNLERTGRYFATDKAVATISNLEFLPLIDPQRIRLNPTLGLARYANARIVAYEMRPGHIVHLLAVREADLGRLYMLRKLSDARQVQLIIVNPKTLKSALIHATQQKRSDAARHDLLHRIEDSSAHTTSTASQGFCLGVVLTMAAYMLITMPQTTIYGIHLLATTFFYVCCASPFGDSNGPQCACIAPYKT